MVRPPTVGWVLDCYRDGKFAVGARVLGFEAYRAGFGLIRAWLVVAPVTAFFTRETQCRKTP